MATPRNRGSSTQNPDNVSAFAAMRTADGALTVMVVDKQLSSSATASIALANFAHRGSAQIWQLTSSNTIARLSDVAFGGTSFVVQVPAQSITLFVVPPQSAPTSPPNPPANVRIVRIE